MSQLFTEGFLGIEDDFLLYIQNLRCNAMDMIMIFVTSLGDKGFIWIAAALVLLFIKKHRKDAAKILTALLINAVTVNLILKPLVMRPRPFDMIDGLTTIIAEPQDWSFPSGHTSSSFAAGLILMMKLPPKYGIPAILTAVMIAFSRVYAGVHYPSDVIAGALIGMTAALASDKIINKIETVHKIRK